MASYLGNMMGMQSTPDDDGEQPRESSLFSLQGGLDETLGSLLGAWQRENPTKLQDVDASWRTSVLHLTQPESEERFLEAQEEGDVGFIEKRLTQLNSLDPLVKAAWTDSPYC